MMGALDVSPIVDALVAKIRTVPNCGLVWPHDIYSHDDLRPMLVSPIAGVPTLRAWWITGPTMAGRNLVQRPGGHIERTWTYTIHGVEGLSASGDSLITLRSNALAVCDAIDADQSYGHRSEPCAWSTAPENRALLAGIGVSYVAITKQVVTVSTP